MRNLQSDLGRRTGAQRLRHRIDRAGIAIARVGGIQCTVASDVATQAGYFFFRRADFRGVFQSGGIAECALLESLAQQPPHGCQPRRIGGAIAQSQSAQTQLAVGHQRQHVDPRPRFTQPVEVFRHAVPPQRYAAVEAVDVAGRQTWIANRRTPETAIADHLQGHALCQRTHRARIDQQRVIRMAVDIDESRCDDQSRRIDMVRRLTVEVTYSNDAPILHANIGNTRRAARAVDHRAARDAQVQHDAATRIRSARSRVVSAAFTASPCGSIATP